MIVSGPRAQRRFALPFLGLLFLAALNASDARAQSWTATATKAYPIQYVSGAILIGAVSPSKSMHIVVGMKREKSSSGSNYAQADAHSRRPPFRDIAYRG